MEFGEMKRNTSNWSNFCMLLRRAGLTASAGLFCVFLLHNNKGKLCRHFDCCIFIKSFTTRHHCTSNYRYCVVSGTVRSFHMSCKHVWRGRSMVDPPWQEDLASHNLWNQWC